ncbi:hypothetical protein [uncultured Bacteroides sp.]|uniref:hypothetical protein n=1 Tax=uncultured Bacteroides sp. TaxID=162156 RepID=UPI002AA95E00|nr:hypothetical protein [uncultured Bacteroides sp.]
MNAKENLLLFVAHIVRFNRLRTRQDRDQLQYARWVITYYVMAITKHVIRITIQVINLLFQKDPAVCPLQYIFYLQKWNNHDAYVSLDMTTLVQAAAKSGVLNKKRVSYWESTS